MGKIVERLIIRGINGLCHLKIGHRRRIVSVPESSNAHGFVFSEQREICPARYGIIDCLRFYGEKLHIDRSKGIGRLICSSVIESVDRFDQILIGRSLGIGLVDPGICRIHCLLGLFDFSPERRHLCLVHSHIGRIRRDLLIRLIADRFRSGGHKKEPDRRCSDQHPCEQIKDRRSDIGLPERMDRLYIAGIDKRRISALILLPGPPDGESGLKSRRKSRLFVHFLQESQGRRVRLIDPDSLLQKFSRFLILTVLNIEEREKVISLDQLRILGQDLLELDHRDVFIAVITVLQCQIILFDRLVDDIQTVRVLLEVLDIFDGNVVVRLNIFGNDPLRERRHDLSHLKIDETEKIPGRDIQLVEFQASPEHIDRPGEISDLSLFEPLIIVKSGQHDRLLLHRNIAAAVRTVSGLCELRPAVHTFHSESLLLTDVSFSIS